MTLKKFLAPNLTVILVLCFLWISGFEKITLDDNHSKNISKYIQVQRHIVNNYVGKVTINKLYKHSIMGMVRNLSDSTLQVAGTPIDTTFKLSNVTNIRESIASFESAYLYISNNLPDEDMTERTEDAIRGMFSILDPHSIYIEPKTSERIQEEFEGKFQGIGVQFDIIKDTITVITPIAGGPSDQLGIISGDRIIQIEDSSAIGFTNRDVLETLRGPKGTKVDVTIKRPGVKGTIDFEIVRDDIPLYTVDTSYMLDEKTGYIKINRFAATTHEEFMKAMNELRQKDMERLVLDLRNNPGGYLSQAIAIAEEFFPRDTVLVSTKSRHARYTDTYKSRRNGVFREKPVIVLVNEGSASASEIVSGAIQDHDRGLIVGQRTFGKGLVQQQYGLIDDSNIRVTISRYYTPSGRLIQKPYDNGRDEYVYEIYKREQEAETEVEDFISNVPDSLKYRTDAGRLVYGGGGIVPDHVIQEDTTTNASVFNFMRRKRAGFNFVRDFLDNHGDAFREEWEDNYDRFREEFEWPKEQKTALLEMIKKEGLVETDTVDAPNYVDGTLYIQPGHYDEVRWMTEGYAKADLARQIWGLNRYYPVINDVFDETLKKAMNLWEEVAQLEKLAANAGTAATEPSWK